MHRSWVSAKTVFVLTAVISQDAAATPGQGGGGGGGLGVPGLVPLRNVPIPEPTQLSTYVRDRQAAILLGKALFWDMQVSSDGFVACGSCHSQAGADFRTKNQVRPVGGPFFSGAPNHQFVAADFPFHKLADYDDQFSTLIFDTPNRAISQGIALRNFVDIVPGSAVEQGVVVADTVFNVGGVNVRRSAATNAPTNHNAVFNFRQLTVSASQDLFNGVDQFGERNTNARVFRILGGQLNGVSVLIDHASLASQATDPPVNSNEMAFAGRTFPKIGKKMLTLTPLANQIVRRNDSVLGPYVRRSGRGLHVGYAELIMHAFQPDWWASDEIVEFSGTNYTISPNPGRPLTTNEFSQMEANFSLFFGLAIQLYEATLITSDTKFDRVIEGNATFTYEQMQGFRIFYGLGDAYGRSANCSTCHMGGELTSQSVANVEIARIERIPMLDGGISAMDVGLRNIGVSRVTDLPGLGFVLPGGLGPLSYVRWKQEGGDIHFDLDPPLSPTERTSAVMAAYKVPGLRNVELTGPYMHNGGFSTLEQVVSFFNRGGDWHVVDFDSKDPAIQPLGLNEEEKCWLIEFLRSMTDERVLHQRAPFDHPQVFVANGHVGDETQVVDDGTGIAVDAIEEVPAVGQNGGRPVSTFLRLDPHEVRADADHFFGPRHCTASGAN